MQEEGPSGRCLMGSLPDRSWRFSFYACTFFGGLSILYHVSVPSAGALGLDWGAWGGGALAEEGACAEAGRALGEVAAGVHLGASGGLALCGSGGRSESSPGEPPPTG